MTKTMNGEGIYIQDDLINKIKDIDSVVFDCDGVLIDVTNSYDLAIQRTTTYVLKEIVKISNFDPVTSQIIDGFKATGGFNDEVDLTYAAIISLVAAHRKNKRGNEFVLDVIENSDKTGIKSVEKYLDSLNLDITDVKKKLAYPGRHLDNLLYSTFDQIFYGPSLYYKLFEQNSKFTEPGLIENDVVLIKKEMLDILKKKFKNKITIVSGRGFESIHYSLKELLDEFDVSNSVFLEDESRELAKPNPESLVRSIKGLNSLHCMYVGDSMEDFIMAEQATKLGNKVTFCGISDTGKFPEQKRKLFEQKNVGMIIKSIDLLPKALNLV